MYGILQLIKNTSSTCYKFYLSLTSVQPKNKELIKKTKQVTVM